MASDGVVLNLVGSKDNLWRELCQISGTMVDFLIDTGSQVTILSASSAVSTGLPVEPAPSHILWAYGGGRVPVIGKITNAWIDLSNFSYSGCVLVTDMKPILDMGFLPNLQIFKECALTHDDSGFIVSFCLQKNCNTDGMCYSAHSLPFSMKALVEVELKRLQLSGVIYPVKNPTVLAPIVPVVKQKGALWPIRICSDYSLMSNWIIDWDSYTLPRLEEILQKVNGVKIFTRF